MPEPESTSTFPWNTVTQLSAGDASTRNLPLRGTFTFKPEAATESMSARESLALIMAVPCETLSRVTWPPFTRANCGNSTVEFVHTRMAREFSNSTSAYPSPVRTAKPSWIGKFICASCQDSPGR